MHISHFLIPALLSASTVADQVPLAEKAQGWFDKAKAYIPSAVPHLPNPIDAGASKVAESKVEKINIRNYERKLQPKLGTEQEWLVYMTGGNKSCLGRCDHADLTWNQSVPLLSALSSRNPVELHLGKINCEFEQVLCTALAASVPSVLHFILPQRLAGAEQPLSPMRDIPLNWTSVAVTDITSLPRATKARALEYPEYTGALHPIDGTLTKFGLLKPLGYVLWAFGSTPSFVLMIGISFISRQIMARRAGSRRPGPGGNLPSVPAPGAGAGAAKKSN